jgi:hypothetical protein
MHTVRAISAKPLKAVGLSPGWIKVWSTRLGHLFLRPRSEGLATGGGRSCEAGLRADPAYIAAVRLYFSSRMHNE